MKKTVGIIAILDLPLLILFSALGFASGNGSKGANHPKHALEKAVTTHDKKRVSSKEDKTARYQVKFDGNLAVKSCKFEDKYKKTHKI